MYNHEGRDSRRPDRIQQKFCSGIHTVVAVDVRFVEEVVHEPVSVSVEAAQPLADVGLRRHAGGRNSSLRKQFAVWVWRRRKPRQSESRKHGSNISRQEQLQQLATKQVDYNSSASAVEPLEAPAPDNTYK